MYFLGFFFLRHVIKPWFPIFRNTQLLLEWALTSSALILILLTIRYLFRNKLSARWRYALWAVVLVRLLVPFQLQLPAAASQAVPLVASNLAPKPPTSWDERDIPLFSAGEQPIEEAHPYYQVLQPGYLGPGPWSDGYIGLSEDGKTVTPYADIFTRNEVVQSIWWVGVLGMCVVLLNSNMRFLFRLEKRRKPLDGTETPVPVYTAEGLPSPCLFGLFRPAVYVTPGAAENPDTLRHVLAHELTHYAHKDHIWSFLRCLALALHWYNPLVWLAVVLSKGDGELACDEGAVARLGEEERIPYGRTLVDMVAQRSLRPADLLSCSTAMTGGKKSIQQRVAQLVKKPETVKAALFAAVAVVALSVVFVFADRAPEKVITSDIFLTQVEEAQRIGIGEPMISSLFAPGNISDPDLLAQAKALLAKPGSVYWLEPDGGQSGGWEPLSLDSNHPPELITFEDLNHQFFLTGRPLNLYPDKDTSQPEQAGRYWLVGWKSLWLLAQWDAQNDARPFTVLGYYGGNVISQLKELARQQNHRIESPSAFDQYLAQVENAAALYYYNPSPFHADEIYPNPIADEDLLPLEDDTVLARSAEPYEVAEFIQSLARTEYNRSL